MSLTARKWIISGLWKPQKKHRSVSNRTFALHTRFNLSIPKLLRPICLDATSKQNGFKNEGRSLFQRSRKRKEMAKSRAQQLSLWLIANSKQVRRSYTNETEAMDFQSKVFLRDFLIKILLSDKHTKPEALSKEAGKNETRLLNQFKSAHSSCLCDLELTTKASVRWTLRMARWYGPPCSW